MNFFKGHRPFCLLLGALLIPLSGHAGASPMSQEEFAAAHPHLIECGPARTMTMDKKGVIHIVNVCSPDAMHEPMTSEAYNAWQAARAKAVADEEWERHHNEGLERQKLGRLADGYEEELSHLPPMRAAWFKSLPKSDQHFMMCAMFLGDKKTVEADLEGCGDVYALPDSEQTATGARLNASMATWEQTHVVINAHVGEPCVFGFQEGHPPSAGDREDMTKACDSGNRGKAVTAVVGPTPRDMATMSPMERQHRVCAQIRAKISVQKDLQAGGSTGYYNLDALRGIELANCGSNRDP
ncbi:hypothetical protein [Xanthomonas sp. NCPPB 2632]|uniref:hypothetical protein n=1 Tax=Xanthomonas sp. NCPPB 2632 TaxID=3240912 RepID=UPI003517C21B